MAGTRTGDWSPYRAEPLHENYHWNTEWVNTLTPELAKAEAEVKRQKVSAASPSGKKRDKAHAEKNLRKKAAEIVDSAVKGAKEKYFKLGDDPGDPAYIAQAPAFDALEQRVRARATTEGW